MARVNLICSRTILKYRILPCYQFIDALNLHFFFILQVKVNKIKTITIFYLANFSSFSLSLKKQKGWKSSVGSCPRGGRGGGGRLSVLEEFSGHRLPADSHLADGVYAKGRPIEYSTRVVRVSWLVELAFTNFIDGDISFSTTSLC